MEQEKKKSKLGLKITAAIVIILFIIVAVVFCIFKFVLYRNIATEYTTTSYSYNCYLIENSRTLLTMITKVTKNYLVIENYSDFIKYKDRVESIYKENEEIDSARKYNLIEVKNEFNNKKYNKEYFNTNSLIIVQGVNVGGRIQKYELCGVYDRETEIDVKIDADETNGDFPDVVGKIMFITVPKKNVKKVNVIYYVEPSLNLNPFKEEEIDHHIAYKPIIYLYPTEEMNVNVKLLLKDNITVSYPKYVDGWNVIAKEDGTLIDLDTNKELYSLYYECDNEKVFNIEEDGFVVEGKDVAEFLDEKLEILGLNSKEREEFIIYWLPKLEANKYNYIRFATKEEIDNNMPLEITPVPETTIRVLMTFKGLDESIDVKEQELTRVERSGYTAVEWGGTEIK